MRSGNGERGSGFENVGTSRRTDEEFLSVPLTYHSSGDDIAEDIFLLPVRDASA